MPEDTRAILDRLFQNAETVITDELGETFTFQEFRAALTHDQQHAYLDLLNQRRDEASPFGSAHFFIYQRLQSRLDEYGLTMEKISEAGDTDLFGNPTTLHRICHAADG